MPELIAPTTRVRRSFLAAVEELRAEGRDGEGSLWRLWIDLFGSRWHEPDGFAEYVRYLRDDALAASPRPAHHVPQSVWWLVEADEYLGRVGVRHALGNDFLREYGGHIGYEVRPTRRREGHATTMLRGVLPHAHALGIDPALVTCDEDNVASRRVIEACGGAPDGRRGVKLRYWVPTGTG